MTTYTHKIVQYRSGSRFVVMAEATDTAGAYVAFGPDTREACEAFAAPVVRDPESWQAVADAGRRAK